jgi:hypothetical protein
MGEISERESRVAESILENESLTSDLEDSAAEVLLDWGIACAKQVVRDNCSLDDAAAEEAMAPRLRAVRQLMRAVNRWIADPNPSAENMALRLTEIVGQAALIYGPSFTPPTQERRDAFAQQQIAAPGQPPERIAALRDLIERPEGAAPPAPSTLASVSPGTLAQSAIPQRFFETIPEDIGGEND